MLLRGLMSGCTEPAPDLHRTSGAVGCNAPEPPKGFGAVNTTGGGFGVHRTHLDRVWVRCDAVIHRLGEIIAA